MTILGSMLQTVGVPGVARPGFSDPLFLVFLVGSLLFLWMLIRFLVDGLDLHGDGEDFSSHLAGGPDARPRRTDRSATETRANEALVVPLYPDTDEGVDPRRPDHRGRPAA